MKIWIKITVIVAVVALIFGTVFITNKVNDEAVKTRNDNIVFKIPNYEIKIGGKQFIEVKVNKHWGWITAIGDGCNWIGTTVGNAAGTVTEWFSELF